MVEKAQETIDTEIECRLENDPRFRQRIAQARDSVRAGRGVRLKDLE
jgi:phage-related baseplate assembly protein